MACRYFVHPHPCGYFSDPKHECRCSHQQIFKYRSKISGPLLDRIDIHVEVPAVPYRDLMEVAKGEPSSAILERVNAARSRQSKRFSQTKIFCNAQMGSRHIKKYCRRNAASRNLMESAIGRLGLSVRAFNRILKISRTISDLNGKNDVDSDDAPEAIQFQMEQSS